MPPVKWKRLFYVMAILVQAAFITDAQQMQHSIDMSSDGWKPIIGSRRQPISQNQRLEVVQADVLNIETTTSPLPQGSLRVQKIQVKNSAGYTKAYNQGVKLKHSLKAINSYYVMSPGPHGSHLSIPIGTNQQNKKHQAKKNTSMVYTKPRTILRNQALAHSSRNEIFVPPPPMNSASYSFVKSISPNNIKTREAQGFGDAGGSNFGINQPNAHIELSRFPLTGENILQRPTFFFPRPMQSDEFTRNLVPPPRLQQQNKDNTHKISLYAFKEGGPSVDATSSYPQIGAKPNQFASQVSPTFDFSTQQQQQKSQKEAVDVQVTKENLQQFSQNGPGPFLSKTSGPLTHNIPGTFGTIHGTRNSFPIQYVDYDFQAPKAGLSNLPNTLTYEVTEGKWLDTPSHQYQFRPQDTFISKKAPLQQNARPGLLFQSDVSSLRPPFFQAPLVDLNVPAFLPTPYNPESSAIPTSPTQSEVSTIFNQVGNKKNRLRNNALKNNPLFFDITEVSTHYPILGTPEAQSESATDIPLPIGENEEIPNEITTQKEVRKERTRRPNKEPTRSISTTDPTRTRLTNRRRPKPRKPLSTTTEETVIDKYEPIKSQDAIAEIPSETEIPQRRRRPKPSLYRSKETTVVGTEDKVSLKNHDKEDQSDKQRGRYRFRNRERPSTERSDANNMQRKRLRPLYSDNVVKEQQKHSFEESTESSIEHEQFSFESNPIDDTYSEQISHPEKSDLEKMDTTSQLPSTFFKSIQEERNTKDDKPFIEEIRPLTEKSEMHEIFLVPSTSTTESDSGTTFHIPENEIDYTTQAILLQKAENDDIATTIQSATEVTTTKSNRIRRPIKYDSSSRPRFSVKDYRQRLNQYTSSSPSPNIQTQQRNSGDNLRLRFPGRLRTRPSPSTVSSRADEEATDEITTTISSRFHPKVPRHQTTKSNLDITEKSVAAVNTQLRPFGRSRMTTEATTPAAKVSIRPNLFSARRRVGYPSLKNRIQNKNKDNGTEEVQEAETITLQTKLEDIEFLKVTESVTTESTLTTTDFNLNQITNEDASTEFKKSTTTEDIMKTDALLYSQRVSDLTSSFKDYDKPGIFNSVAPTSRSIPNYFTISTDDPILPIEAFFPNLKEKTKER